MASDAAAQNVPPNSTNDPIKPAARFAFVDGLRGLAALGIALYHTWRYEPAMTTNPLTYASNDLVRLLCREPCGRTSVVCVCRGSERPLVLAEESPSAITVQSESGQRLGGTPSDLPPSIASAVPVTMLAASLTRYRIAAAISSGRLMRPNA